MEIFAHDGDTGEAFILEGCDLCSLGWVVVSIEADFGHVFGKSRTSWLRVRRWVQSFVYPAKDLLGLA